MERSISYGSDYKYLPITSINSDVGVELVNDVYLFTTQISNIVIVGEKNHKQFILIDAGMPKSTEQILTCVKERFGDKAKPAAILLTHGHFDHVGALIDLVKLWKVPVYAHRLELAYLTGQSSYPIPDSTVEGGMVAKISGTFPIEPIDLGSYIHPLPEDGSVPSLSEFKWIATSGHSPGHVSFFRERDRTLIAGDAFITAKQDSLYNVLTQKLTIQGPPRYLTPDWNEAWRSVKKLRQLKPEIAITGHREPLYGSELQEALRKPDEQFDTIAIPYYGKFID